MRNMKKSGSFFDKKLPDGCRKRMNIQLDKVFLKVRKIFFNCLFLYTC